MTLNTAIRHVTRGDFGSTGATRAFGLVFPWPARFVVRTFCHIRVKLLFECGFYVEHRLFGKRLPPVIEAMPSNRRGDGHNAPKKRAMKQSQDTSFDYRLTWIEGGSDKGWSFHCRPKHLPPSAEIASLSVSNSSSRCHGELHEPPAVRDPAHLVELGTSPRMSAGKA